jgi:hypothetical protein
VTGLEPVLGYLAAWVLRKAGRVGQHLDRKVDAAIDHGLERLFRVVKTKLRGEPALVRFEQEALREVDNAGTQGQLLRVLGYAVGNDQWFAAELRRLVDDLREQEARAGVSIIGQQVNTASYGGIVNSVVYGSINTTNVHNEYHVAPVFKSTLPGRVLTIFGTALLLVAFGGWASIIFRGMASQGEVGFGPNLPSGIPLAAFYFITFGGGGIIAVIGSSMVTSVKTYKRWTLGHALASIVVITATLMAVQYARGSAPYEYLLPHFADCGNANETNGAVPRNRGGPFNSVTLEQWVCASN